MSKYITLGTDPAVAKWSLPDDINIEKLKAELAEAMEEEKTMRIEVVLGAGQTGELLVNGGELQAVLVWETTPSQPTFTIID